MSEGPEKEKTRKALEIAMEKITKSGNLNGALAVKSAIEKLDKADTEVKFDLLGNPVKPDLSGKWVLKDEVTNATFGYSFNDDKTTPNGTWEMTSEELILKFNSGNVCTFKFKDIDNNGSMIGQHSNGNKHVLSKAK